MFLRWKEALPRKLNKILPMHIFPKLPVLSFNLKTYKTYLKKQKQKQREQILMNAE